MVRNVCILGHGSSGKTSLVEAMLHNAGVSDRFGRVVDGTTVMDFDPEEIKRKISLSASIAAFNWKNCKINAIDTPGYLDFAGEVIQSVRVADAAVIVVSGKSGVAVGTEKAWEYCAERGIPRIIFINKVDDERADFTKTLEQLREKFGKRVAPFEIRIKEGDKIIGFVDVLEMKGKRFEGKKLVDMDIPADVEDMARQMHEMIKESVAETDEELMERYFSGEEFTLEEIHKALRKGINEGTIYPVLCGSAQENSGVEFLMDCIVEFLPSCEERPEERASKPDGSEVTIEPKKDGPLAAFVFKTVADPFVGKISYFKVLSGVMQPDSVALNATNGEQEKIGHLFFPLGKKQLEAKKVEMGDIGAVAKLVSTKTGDTLCSPSNPVVAVGVSFPEPNLILAVEPKAKGDEEKIASGLHKLMEEDQTFKVENNTETHQTLIKGIGEQHLDVIVSKLKSKFGVSVDLTEPRVPYRETLKKKVKVEGKHKKQSGGHGQYGHVWIEFEPGDVPELVFEEKIFGGAVPRNYFPAVEKGLQESILHGVLAGFPVVNLKATLVDGSYHPVDSSELAFKVAASLAYKKGMEEASPVLLEPIGHLEVKVPDNYMGDVIGDINKRRGRVLGMGSGEVSADIPMAEMHRYAIDLRSITQGRGSFTFAFERYEEAPANVAQKVMEEYKKES